MTEKVQDKSYHVDSPLWIWSRIRAIRNYRYELGLLESSLIELKRLAELEIRKRKIPEQPTNK